VFVLLATGHLPDKAVEFSGRDANASPDPNVLQVTGGNQPPERLGTHTQRVRGQL
jgi:hypothetical protein